MAAVVRPSILMKSVVRAGTSIFKSIPNTVWVHRRLSSRICRSTTLSQIPSHFKIQMLLQIFCSSFKSNRSFDNYNHYKPAGQVATKALLETRLKSDTTGGGVPILSYFEDETAS